MSSEKAYKIISDLDPTPEQHQLIIPVKNHNYRRTVTTICQRITKKFGAEYIHTSPGTMGKIHKDEPNMFKHTDKIVSIHFKASSLIAQDVAEALWEALNDQFTVCGEPAFGRA